MDRMASTSTSGICPLASSRSSRSYLATRPSYGPQLCPSQRMYVAALWFQRSSVLNANCAKTYWKRTNTPTMSCASSIWTFSIFTITSISRFIDAQKTGFIGTVLYTGLNSFFLFHYLIALIVVNFFFKIKIN